MDDAENVQVMRRTKAIAAALASVHTEGLQPSRSAIVSLNQYANGKIDAERLKQEVRRNRASAKQKINRGPHPQSSIKC